MAGWIAVSFLGAVASMMFFAANYRPRSTVGAASGLRWRAFADAGAQGSPAQRVFARSA